MNWSQLTRQIHRWTSLAFALAVLVNFAALTLGEPAAWVYFMPLPPLALLLITGLCLFLLPHVAAWRGGRPRTTLG